MPDERGVIRVIAFSVWSGDCCNSGGTQTGAIVMAAIWKGFLNFGLVNVPVELRPAVREDHVRFRLLHKADMSPVKYERVCERDGEKLDWKDIVKGFEVAKDDWVVLEEDDFKAVAMQASKAVEIVDFVKQEEIDPRFFDTPYYLVPAAGGEKAYALLREAIRKAGCIGIGKIVIRQTQHLAGVKAVGKALVLELMRFSTELVDADGFGFPDASAIRKPELDLAEQLVESLRAPFDPTRYKDDYRENLMEVIEAKRKGVKPTRSPAEQPEGKIINLMEQLRKSLGKKAPAARGAKAQASNRGKPPVRTPRKKSA